MSNVGIPIKLLFEAEGMKVTVEVGSFFLCLRGREPPVVMCCIICRTLHCEFDCRWLWSCAFYVLCYYSRTEQQFLTTRSFVISSYTHLQNLITMPACFRKELIIIFSFVCWTYLYFCLKLIIVHTLFAVQYSASSLSPSTCPKYQLTNQCLPLSLH